MGRHFFFVFFFACVPVFLYVCSVFPPRKNKKKVVNQKKKKMICHGYTEKPPNFKIDFVFLNLSLVSTTTAASKLTGICVQFLLYDDAVTTQ